ncbi:MAG: alpha-E domain-containing protein, partial [Gammaproteobacteria bacterium]
MSLLSRVAERTYWSARYLERAENSARLISVYGNLLLDLPEEAGVGWDTLIDISGNANLYREIYPMPNARSPMRFLVSDTNNPSSIRASLRMVRENIRTTRDIFPSEAWRNVNELYLFSKDSLRGGISDRRRHEVLSRIVAGCQQINGMLAANMSHGPAYQFVRMGRNVERADMTTRVMDVATAALLKGSDELTPYTNTVWMAVLRSLSAYQMYRQYVRRRVVPEDVLAFVLTDEQFPRALRYCLEQLDTALRKLPRPEDALRAVARLQRQVDELDFNRLDHSGLHEWIDMVQLELGV